MESSDAAQQEATMINIRWMLILQNGKPGHILKTVKCCQKPGMREKIGYTRKVPHRE